MKKLVILLFILFTCVSVSAQSDSDAGILPLDKLGPDLSTLFGGMGDEILVHMNQISLAGTTIGKAELGNFPHFSWSILGLGVSVFDGIGSVMRNPNTIWQFEALPIPSLVETNVGGISGVSDIYDATKYLFGLPAIHGGLGMGVIYGFEVFASGFYVSNEMVDSIAGAFGAALPAEIAPLDLEMANVNIKVRKVLLSEQRIQPALSVSLGYDHSSTKIGYSISSLDMFLDEPIDLLGTELDIRGDFMLNGTTNAFGVDLHLSKTLIYLFTPFIKLSTWYHASSYAVSAKLVASQTTPGATEPTREETLDVAASGERQDVSVYVTGGLDINLFVLILHVSLGIDLQGAALAIGDAFSGSFENTNVNNVNLNIGLRLEI
jgi:hypothetical protein